MTPDHTQKAAGRCHLCQMLVPWTHPSAQVFLTCLFSQPQSTHIGQRETVTSGRGCTPVHPQAPPFLSTCQEKPIFPPDSRGPSQLSPVHQHGLSVHELGTRAWEMWKPDSSHPTLHDRACAEDGMHTQLTSWRRTPVGVLASPQDSSGAAACGSCQTHRGPAPS